MAFRCINATSLARAPFQKFFGIGCGGAVLIRSDGHVAWRSQALPRAMATIPSDVSGKLSFTEMRDQDVEEHLVVSHA